MYRIERAQWCNDLHCTVHALAARIGCRPCLPALHEMKKVKTESNWDNCSLYAYGEQISLLCIYYNLGELFCVEFMQKRGLLKLP